MSINIENLNINYIKKGEGKNIILLHGWGANYQYFNNIIINLSQKYCVYAIDLPGFGKSDTPSIIMGTHDYANIIKHFINNLKIKNPTIIAHSFGGKITLDLAINNPTLLEKIILIDSAGIKKKKSIIKRFKTYQYKTLKKIITSIYSKERSEYLIDDLRKKYGSKDYNECEGIMQKILIKVVNEDYKNELNLINTPTLLIWGEKDIDTPLKDAYIMEKSIKNSGLVIIKNAKHFPFISNSYEFLIIINKFLES